MELGLTFVTAALAVTLACAMTTGTSSGRSSCVRAQGATVFLADDDDDFRASLRRLLVDEGYAVVEAADGAKALEILAAAADGNDARIPVLDVALLDVRMPRFSGLGILQATRRFRRAPPAIVLTGWVDASVERLARELGALRVLRKPVDDDVLLGALLDATTMSRSAEQQR